MNVPSDQKLTYLEIWALRRKAGYIVVTLKTSVYAWVFLVFLRVCYSFYTRNLTFTTLDALILILPAFVIATFLWFVNEIYYKVKKNK